MSRPLATQVAARRPADAGLVELRAGCDPVLDLGNPAQYGIGFHAGDPVGRVWAWEPLDFRWFFEATCGLSLQVASQNRGRGRRRR